MNASPPKNPSGWPFTCLILLVALAAFAPTLIAIGQALLPLLIILGVVAIVVRLIFFHTRDW